MKHFIFKPKHEDTLLQKSLSLKSQISYINIALAAYSHKLQNWEIAEYKEILSSLSNEMEQAKAKLLENQSVFNEILAEYNTSVVVFIAKHLN